MEGKKYLYPSDYMADPSVHVYNDRLYIYPSHDWDAGECEDDDGGHFQMRDYHVLSFDDLENGQATDHGVILDVDQVPWAEKQMWDSDVVEKDGKYYLYCFILFSKGCVAVSDRPEGPFQLLSRYEYDMPEELVERYKKQLDLYAQALCRIFSTKEHKIDGTENFIYSFRFDEAIKLNLEE